MGRTPSQQKVAGGQPIPASQFYNKLPSSGAQGGPAAQQSRMRDKLLINSGGLALGSPATGSAIKNPPLHGKAVPEISQSASKK